MAGFFIILAGCAALLIFGLPLSSSVMNAGSLVGLLLGCFLVLYGIFRPKLSKKIRRGVLIFILIFIVFNAIPGAFMAGRASRSPDRPGTLVVLGCRVRGQEPTLMLRTRIDAAAEYLKAHPDMKAVCSGGLGSGADISEAACIYRELLARGIEAERLYIEDQSTSTSENLVNSLAVMEREGLDRHLILLSNEFHLYRAWHMAGRMGLEASTVPAATPLYLLPGFYLREVLAIWKEWVWPDPV